jgi:ribosomal protein S11
MASIGTPFGSSHSGAMVGHCEAGAAKRALAGDLSLVVRGGPGAEAVAEDATRALVAAGLPAERVKRAPSPHAGQVVVSL